MISTKTISENRIVFAIDDFKISDETVNGILKYAKIDKIIAIDMKNIKYINSEKFIKCLLKNRFKLFNLQSEVLAFLAIVLKDGLLKSHMSLEDLLLNKRELVKRHFLVA